MSAQHLNLWTGQPEQLTPEQTQAEDPTFAAAHPAEAALGRYYNPFYGPQTFQHRLGEGARKWLYEAPTSSLGEILNRGPLAGAGAGGALGAGAGALLGLLGGNAGNGALAGGAIGAGLGALSGHLRTKTAGLWRSDVFDDPHGDIINALSSSNMGFSEKARCMAAIPQLNSSQAQDLAGMLGHVSGFMVGAVVARYLLGCGLLGTLAGGLAGSLFSNRNTQRDISGNPVLGSHSYFS